MRTIILLLTRMHFKKFSALTVIFIMGLSVGTVSLTPLALAQEVAADTSSQQGTDQGQGQGGSQGTDQGGPSLASLGLTPDENGNYDTSSLGPDDPRLGASQGGNQGTQNDGGTSVTAANEQTGADSTNTSGVDSSQTSSTNVANTSDTANGVVGSATTGQNASSENTGPGSVNTGTAGVGVQQVTADNLNTAGSYGEIGHNVSGGSQNGDVVLNLDQGNGGNPLDESFRSTNSVTGAGSDNATTIENNRESLTEIQNDGRIRNDLDAAAISGQNDATQNTGNADITTGNANVAATLLNFLNANVIDGALWLEVADIFGDLNGNVVIPEEAIAYLTRRQRELLIEVGNDGTGANSTNTVDVDVLNSQETNLLNNADVENNVNVDAITGQNQATQNTGGSTVATGDVFATTNTVTLANMNVVDGNLGIIIINALNRWLGFLLGSDGSWTPIGHDFTTAIAAQNNQTGADSTNTANVDVTNTEEVSVTNDASVVNNVNLAAITGQNTANQNTGNASVRTGDARVNATVVNVVNTNVIRGGLFVAVVNIFGNWFGDFFFGGQSASALAASHGGATVNAENANTGADSTNTVDVNAESDVTLDITNNARIRNNLTVNADTGHNEANRNTGLGSVDTGDALAALHARNVANVTLAGIASTWANITAELANATTGADSTNTIDVTVNDERDVTILNNANVDTAIGAVANTGFNTANRNTLGGIVTTGAATIDAFIQNLLNQVWLVGYEYGDDPGYGGIRITEENTNTGAGSTNSNNTDANVNTDVTIGNDAHVHNDITADATSGNNQANDNTGGGAVGSGNAGIGGGIENTVNQTDVSGGSGGSFHLDVDSDADITNTVQASASSGNNEANRNTGTLPSRTTPPVGGTPPPSGGLPGVGGGSDVGSFGGEGDIKGAETLEKLAAAPKGSASSIGPLARVAQAADGVERPSRFPTAGSDGRFLDVLRRLWFWTLLAAVLALLGNALGVPRRVAAAIAGKKGRA